ncbi:alpha/beta-hydrolase [Gymnopus androsaceus JB14]|uniref:Alpha/beta-hydrolase n=1 Tax=Gymnopus androsaceus JB14 TaxID=1447944 RepID=A0A6A4I351_9AGAR|nr:alpha/beta-hydrolase [Gymnopus androsaceus JB14]
MSSTNSPLTLTYKTVKNVPIQLDVYPPTKAGDSTSVNSAGEIAAVLWFHGGGLTFGNRTNFFPKWLQTRTTGLIPTGSITAHDVVDDVKDAFAFLRGPAFSSALDALAAEGKLPFAKFRIDPKSIAVAGSSAGGTCAYFAAMHVEPKPACVLSVFATGGDLLISHYFEPKTEPFLRGRPLLDPSRSQDYLYPLSPSVASDIVADSPLAFNPPAGPGLPPIPANPRMPLALLYLQLGTYLDYYTGEHEPSLSKALRAASAEAGSDPEAKKPKHSAIFPQFGVDSSWPATLLIHGSDDTAVPVTESQNIYEALQRAGVPSRIKIVQGEDHFFEQTPDAEDIHGKLFDDAASFLKRRLTMALASPAIARAATPVTLIYKNVDPKLPIKMDVYPPPGASSAHGEIGAVLWFHGGGFTFGNRASFFPKWLQRRVNDLGIAFISADYRLIPTGSITAHDIIEDVKDAFAFLRTQFNSTLEVMDTQGLLPFEKFRLDPRGIAVAGSSAGGTAAYFAAMHVSPKPAACLSIFATGGDCLNPHYFIPKTEPFIRGRPLLDPSRSKDYLYPIASSVASEVISDSPLAFNPPAGPGLPPLPANPRMPLALLYLQLGTYLDYYTGEYGLSEVLRAASESDGPDSNSSPKTDGSKSTKPKFHTILTSGFRNASSSSKSAGTGKGSDSTNPLRPFIPAKHLPLFPQFNVDASWPPTLLIHGSEDTSVPVSESKRMYELLQEAGVASRLTIVEGEDHFFDQAIGKPSEEDDNERERKFGAVFDGAAGFLRRRIDAAKSGQIGGGRVRSRSRSAGQRK